MFAPPKRIKENVLDVKESYKYVYTNVRVTTDEEYRYATSNKEYLKTMLNDEQIFKEINQIVVDARKNKIFGEGWFPQIRVCINFKDKVNFVTLTYGEFVRGRNAHGVKLDQIRRERAKMTPKLRFTVLKRDNFTCQYCGARASDGVRLHVDQIVPVSRGGLTELDNLTIACEMCNIGKSDMYLD